MWYYYPYNELYHHGILGQKWGVRRYQNSDGTLTELGKRRYDREVQRDGQKKKENRAKDESVLKDPNRWVQEDLSAQKKLTDSANTLVRSAMSTKSGEEGRRRASSVDLSTMSDEELRAVIDRKMKERQYRQLLAEEYSSIPTGKDKVYDILDGAGKVLGVTSSVIGIALAIKELQGLNG